MRRPFAALLAVGSCLAIALPAQAAVPGISARAAVLIDAQTGQVLFARNPHLRLPQASTTKITTAIVALERGKLADAVTASKRASDTAGSSLYLMPGEKLSLEQMLQGLLLVSGNDAAIALAEHVGGTQDGFVDLMNAKVRELGLADTHYANPNGLPAKDHYTSAFDLASILRYGLTNPDFARISGTRVVQMPGNARMPFRILVNHNRLLRDYPGAGGGKTGFTTQAGRCFVGSATRDGRTVVEALLDAPDLWTDARTLLTYGLHDFRTETLAAAGEPLGQVAVKDGERGTIAAHVAGGLSVTVAGDDHRPLRREVSLSPGVKAPVAAGQPLGEVRVYAGTELLRTAPLVATDAVAYVSPLVRLARGVATAGACALPVVGGVFFWRRRRPRSRRVAALALRPKG